MADVPLPRAELTAPDLAGAIPTHVHDLLGTLWSGGYGAYVVGGSLRDALLDRPVGDWDLATSALPEQVLDLFPGNAVYENRFGTVAVRPAGQPEVQITTFRSDHDYADFRRPHRVEFSDSIELDLNRRDFTVNAIAWGAPAAGVADLLDPHGGVADVDARLLRAVGDPLARFEEDALRMIRAVRFAATLEFTIEPATLAAIQACAELVEHLSGERLAEELWKLLGAERPSIGLRLLADTGLLAHISPELAAQRGVPQNKVEGEDLWDHTLRAVDGTSPEHRMIRFAALLHDIGKPATFADGRFLGHEIVGAGMADALLERLRWRGDERERIVRLVRHHMFGYDPSWSDAAVRRLIQNVGREHLDDLFLLREADNIGSGRPREGSGLAEIRARVAAQLADDAVVDLRGLAVRGDDLITELGIPPGPLIGRLLEDLLELVIADPSLNRRDRLLERARSLASGPTA
jgi:poly(A) polymerase/tRNA nucleotidyltransferase (CCA-adding enzyme)